MDHMQSFILCS